MIENEGCKVGVVLNPATPISFVETYLGRVELLTILTVDPGFAGQPFINEMLDKIKAAARLREENGYTYKIQVDGAVNKGTFKQLKDAGADIFVLGSSGLFNLDDDLLKACSQAYENFYEVTK